MNQVITSDTFRRDVYTVTRLNTEARAVLEATFPAIWIEGELSNFAHPRSGHMYFSLKDEQAQVRCAMFRQNNRQLDFKPQDGSQVLARGRVGLYRDRGDFQLVIEYMELAGDGALRRAFEALKQRLSAEGLFADERKQALPSLPSRVGVVTSATGAALRDVLNVLARRFPGLPVVIYPTLVQGEAASRAIATAIETADQRGECDVLLLVRGGGSLEDLWAFNEETTARAIAQCTIPIVAGVGHETDFTIADLVADHRAPTPSAAAELISPDQYELHERLDALDARLLSWIRGRLRTGNRDLELTAKRLQHPRVGLARMREQSSQLEKRLARARRARFTELRTRLTRSMTRLQAFHPARDLAAKRERLAQLNRRLARVTPAYLSARQRRLDELNRAFRAISPERTLERGYAIVTRRDTGDIVKDAKQVAPGEKVQARLAQGTLVAVVETSE